MNNDQMKEVPWSERLSNKKAALTMGLLFVVAATSVFSSSEMVSNYDSSSIDNPVGFATNNRGSRGHEQLSRFLGQTTARPTDDLDNGPEIIWMFAFPQSGSMHYQHILHHMSLRATATNHGNLQMTPRGDVVGAPMSRNSMVVYGNKGPALMSGNTLSVPDKKILTLTEAYGTCRNCHPKEYKFNKIKFREALWTATVIQNGKRKTIEYNTNNVKGGVHLFRFPFDNILLRYWAHREQKDVTNHNGWVAKYGAGDKGFNKWCDTLDSHWYETELAWYGEEVMKLSEGVPCRQEFYKFIMYHNNVECVERGAALPMYHLKYEDLYTRYHQTIGDLFKFLEYPVVRPAPVQAEPLRVGFSRNYFTAEQKARTYAFMNALAEPETKKMLADYEATGW